MAAIDTVISLQDKMSKQLDRIEKASRNTQNAFKTVNTQVETMDKKMNQASKSSGSFLKSMIAFSGISKIFGMVTGQIGAAINRLDRINNYENVMSGLGFGAEQSQQSINRLKTGLDGLPTTLDDAVQSVQRFASANGNIAASTEITLALNDALAAGGAPAFQQAAALEQISQAYAKGKFDAMEYRAMMSAMPAQLKQVAETMGYTSTALGGDFYTALQKGKISMNDMMKTMVELDHQTGGFHDQALNATAGIQTAFTNMKTAITKGLTDLLDYTNKALESANLPNIATIIKNIGITFRNSLTAMQPIIGAIINGIVLIRDNWATIEPILRIVGIAILVVVAAITAYNIIMAIGTFITTVMTIAQFALAFATGTKASADTVATASQLGLNAAMLACPAFWVALIIIALIVVLIYLWNTNDTVAYYMLLAWDSLIIGVMTLKLGCEAAFYAIIIAALYMYQGFLGVKMGLLTAFYTLQIGALALKLGFQGVCEGIVNAFIWMYNKVADILNKLGGHFEHMNYADFTSETTKAISNKMGEYANSMLDQYAQMNEVAGQINDYKAQLADVVNEGASNIQTKISTQNATRQQRTNDRTTISSITNAIKGAVSEATNALPIDWNDMNNATQNAADGGKGGAGKALKDVTGTDKAGEPAIQTTTNDDLLSDEDIQLLLDVATRDYKLNYQQITPEFTLTFGDIRETVDVDRMLDQVADRLEAIYNGNLRVGAI